MTLDSSTHVDCPAEDCDYDGLLSEVCGHYSGRRDEQHAGGWEKAKILIEDMTDDPDDEHSSEEQSFDDHDEQPADENPLVDVPASDDDSHDDGGPCCGDAQLEDVEPNQRIYRGGEPVGATEDGDRQCAACGAIVGADGTVVR